MTPATAAVTTTVSAELLAQREYVRKVEQVGFDFGLTVADAFIRGIRDIGYKSTATALDELVDNSIQAEAENVHVIFGFDPVSTGAKPDRLAVMDNGHGMDPKMIRLAVIWGGTHRENNRVGFGRYGYGLPSASISQAKAFTVYSWVEGADVHAVTIDLDGIAAGTYGRDGRIVVPEAQPAELPTWVSEAISAFYGSVPAHGTVVVLEKLDRLTRRTTQALERHLLEHFGVTYRNFLRQVNLFVNGTRVQAVDPLFITPGFRYYDLDDDRAEALPPAAIDVKSTATGEFLGTVKVRYSRMPPAFGTIPSEKLKERGKKNGRFQIMKEHNGIIVSRAGRQIDVVTRCPWTTFVNYDVYWKVEIDFPPALDEEFAVTTSKQQIVLSERMWDLLKAHNVYKAIEDMRAKDKLARAKLQASRDQGGEQKKPSEATMEEAGKFKTKPPVMPVERQKEVQRKLQLKAAARAEQLDISVEEAEKGLESEAQGRPYKVEVENLPGAPFYRMEQIGGQKILYLNGQHRFYGQVYAGPDSTPRWRAALEVMLFVMGDCELDAADDRRRFYETERAEWSGRLSVALDLLKDHIAAPEPSGAEDRPVEESPPGEPVGAGKTTTTT
jgi:hypothetical protein